MSRPIVDDALDRWRRAEAAWSEVDHADPAAGKAAAEAVVAAWLAYQEATSSRPDEVLLVADASRRFVAVSASSQAVLGYAPATLLGMTIDSLAAVPSEETAAAFQRFLEEGRMAGVYPLRTASGRVTLFDYEARAHHPVPGHHLSRLRPSRI